MRQATQAPRKHLSSATAGCCTHVFWLPVRAPAAAGFRSAPPPLPDRRCSSPGGPAPTLPTAGCCACTQARLHVSRGPVAWAHGCDACQRPGPHLGTLSSSSGRSSAMAPACCRASTFCACNKGCMGQALPGALEECLLSPVGSWPSRPPSSRTPPAPSDTSQTSAARPEWPWLVRSPSRGAVKFTDNQGG